MTQQDDVAEQRNYDSANRAYDRAVNSSAELFKSVIAAASGALRVLLVINAGGAIALLGFVGAIAGKDKHVFASSAVFVPPFSAFGIGLLLAAGASCLMYFAQAAFALSLRKKYFDYRHPWLHDTLASKQLNKIGVCLQIITIGFAILSFAAFTIGLCEGRYLISSVQL